MADETQLIENEAQEQDKKKTRRKKYTRYLVVLWSIFVIGFVTIFMIFYGIVQGWFGYMPDFEELENPKINQASEVYSADSVLLGKYYRENRSNIDYAELSPHLVNALLATEDIRFRDHSGVDFRALTRVAYGVLTGNHKGGGSTISQQLAKALFPRERNMSKMDLVMRKFKEWVTATMLERRYSKDEIIAMYFNTVDFGHQSWGVKSAAATFFNKTPMELNVEEAALLVGVVNAPSRFSPIRNPERSTKRRNVVISQMEKYEFVNPILADTLRNTPIDMSNYRILSHKAGIGRHFREYLRKWLKEWASTNFKADGSPYDIYQDGLKIYTTIDSRLQTYAEKAVYDHMALDLQPSFEKHWKGYTYAPFVFEKTEIKDQVKKVMNQGIRRSERYRLLKLRGASNDSIKKAFNTPAKMRIFSWKGNIDTVMTPTDSVRYYKSILQTGLMSVEPHTGYVKAYVGNIDYNHFKYDHVKQAKRQVGSTFKPILYTLAMESGAYSPCTEVPNVQVSIPQPNGDLWEPRNDSRYKRDQMISLKEALAHSNNWISAYLIKQFSPLSVIKLAQKMGIENEIPAVHAISLGTPDLTLYEMVGAVNTFANKGIHVEPIFVTHIVDKNGAVLERFIPETNEAMSEETAYLMLDLMKGVKEFGTGTRLKYKYGFKHPIAGKTGTTQNQSDGWFMGLTPDLVTGVWVGCEDRAAHFRTIRLGQGANMALPIWALYMGQVYNDSTINISMEDFEKPIRPLSVEIDCDKWQQQNKSFEAEVDESDF
jgi:penicillin-binding protein 1A